MSVAQKEKKNQLHRVFLSYAIKDREYAHKLYRLLSQYSKLNYIFTPEMLSAGEDWLSKIRNEILRCDIFVVLLSPNSINSGSILTELGAAWALNKLIIPVITQHDILSEIPMDWKEFQSVEIKYLEDHPEIINQILEQYEEKTAQ